MLTSIWHPPAGEVEEIRAEVLSWFRSNGRDLPWRRTRNAHCILVAEMMLQQTQVARVVPYYSRFIDAFPDTATLATSSLGAVLRLWQGLGYNRRAHFVHEAAQRIESEFGGQLPQSIEELQTLPGVGRYTARAIACFAFEQQVTVMETNIRRALRWSASRLKVPDELDLEVLAGILLPPDNAWEWNQAFMDYGALRVPRTLPVRVRKGRNQTPFEHTDRFWRGRIIAALCTEQASLSLTMLLRELPDAADEYRIRTLIKRMDEEGLIAFDAQGDSTGLPS